MEEQRALLEELIEKTGNYTKLTIEVYRLKAIDKAGDVIAASASFIVLMVCLTLFFMALNVGLALWIGDLLGKNFLGFLILSAFYGLIGLVLYLQRDKWLKVPIKNAFVEGALEQ